MPSTPFPNGVPVASFVLARTPLFPFDDLLSLSEGLRAPAAVGDLQALDAAVAEDRAAVRCRLEALMSRPEAREALLVGSPDLLTRFESAGGLGRDPRLELAIARYALRMCGRPTPFGLFAGVTLGAVGERTVIALAARAEYARHARLDNDVLFALVDRLERAPEIAATLRFTPTSSLYEAAGSYRYAETRLDGTSRTNHLVAVEATEYLTATLERARAGATIEALAAALAASDPEISIEEARSYVGELVKSGILVSDLIPSITGQEPLDDLLERLGRHPGAAAARERLRDGRNGIASLARSPLGLPRESYAAAARPLVSLPVEVEPSRFLQLDLLKPAAVAELGPEPLAEIARGLELLWRLTPTPRNPALARFIAAFFERYEGRDVPLVEALDEDLGIEFRMEGRAPGGAAPLLEGLNFAPAPDETTRWTRLHDRVQRRLHEVIAEGRIELALDDTDIAGLERRDTAPLPPAFAVMATIAAASPEAVARGEFQVVLQFAAGPSGANWLGRFCQADPELRERVAAHLRSEERHAPDAIFAEIVHLPEGRLGNIIARPVLRDCEIPYLGRSSAAADRQIPVTDLTLALEGDRLVLRSRRLGREVIPRLTSAHNAPASSLPIYRFLAAFQSQGTTPWLHWDWGPLGSSSFLPRVRSGRVVLSPARWKISDDEARLLRNAPGARRYALVQELRAARRMPRFVLLAEGDNRLPLDLDNVLCVDVLADLAAHGRGATLEEMIPAPEALLARGPEGRYVHELVVPFVQPPPPRAAEAPRARPRIGLVRAFPPGSEWLYAKLYAGEASADRVLREIVAPLRRVALERGVADRWFFVRFSDPHPHVRLRLHGDPAGLVATVIPALRDTSEPLLRDGTLRRLQIDTYEREIERYGGDDGMLLAERLFHEDSEAVLEIVNGLAGDAGARARSRLALAGIDRMLDAFGLDLAAKRTAVAGLRDAIGRDVRADKRLHVQLGDSFRRDRRELTRLIDGAVEDDALRAGLEILDQRSARLAPIAAELAALAAGGRLSMEPISIVPSHVHMFVNRITRSQHKRQEFVLYDYLGRIYESRAARQPAIARR